LDRNLNQAWRAIADTQKHSLTELFASNAGRLEQLSGRLELGDGVGIFFDWSKTHLDDTLLSLFETVAEAVGFTSNRDAMFQGAVVNYTEDRAATHMAQRGTGSAADVTEAATQHARNRVLVEAISAGKYGKIESLIHIGIGGSALGPALAIRALSSASASVSVFIVSNIDGTALETAMNACNPATTLVTIASKTFTTIETMTNAKSVLRWFCDAGIADAQDRLVGLTACPARAEAWGIKPELILPFPESVGGRYSLWSSIGFPIAVAIGWDAFSEMLHGAQCVDQHFKSTDGRRNLCLRAAFADQLYTRVYECQTRACFVYDERLKFLPDYLQQLEMESNGKSVRVDGSAITTVTAPITWGGVGTDAQHAVFQLLHQGTNIIPVDFIASLLPGHRLNAAHHQILLLNCFAQGAALMAGRASDDLAKSYAGNRPSSTILCDRIDARTLGALIAFHEHRTFANAALLQINPFDQFGVELGKEIAGQLQKMEVHFDPSTQGLIERAQRAGVITAAM
jgi:glucose-6-phosphate isomerase